MNPRASPRGQYIRRAFAVALMAMGASGKLSADDNPASADVIVLEKMIVEATRADDPSIIVKLFQGNTTWLYVALPDYEILSQCDTEQTVAVSRHLTDSLLVDKEFVPDAYLAPLSPPMSFIMFDHEHSKAMDTLIPNSLDVDTMDTAFFGIYHNSQAYAAGGTDTCDSDTHCVVQNRRGMAYAWAGGGIGRGPIPTGLWFQISQCKPALPLWYQLGFIGPCGLLRMAPGTTRMILASATWISEAETKKVLSEATRKKTLPELPPIQELFNRSNFSNGRPTTEWPSPTWMAEAALFLRWGLYGDKLHRQSFDTFVERSRVEPVTEAMFRECFGFGYAEMQSRLSRYLKGPAREPVIVDYRSFVHLPNYDPKLTFLPKVPYREATAFEIARIIGDWERMEGKAKKTSDPALSAVYIRQAGKTLHRCYDGGERDPRFLAVLGLYDFDVGAKSEARTVLKAATDAEVARPAAYVALGQLYYEEAMEHTGNTGGNLRAQQLAAVLKPLFAVMKKARLEVAGYLLIAEAWSHSVEKPSLANLEVLREGIGFYPFDSELILSTAKAYAQWGYVAEAEAIIDQKAQCANALTAEKLLNLETTLKVGSGLAHH